METVIRAIAEQERLFVVGALIEVVAQFVMDGDEILFRNIEANLDAQVIEGIEIPRAGVAHNVAVARLGEHGALPERGRQRRESQRGEEVLAIVDHVERLRIALFRICVRS